MSVAPAVAALIRRQPLLADVLGRVGAVAAFVTADALVVELVPGTAGLEFHAVLQTIAERLAVAGIDVDVREVSESDGHGVQIYP